MWTTAFVDICVETRQAHSLREQRFMPIDDTVSGAVAVAAEVILGAASATIRFVYVNGPSWLGSWEGQSEADICSGLTHVDAKHWTDGRGAEACDGLLDRKVRATVIGIGALSAAIVACSGVHAAVQSAVRATLQSGFCCRRR